ncbi:hypothetical protein [Sphingobium sp. CFD-1]|uniref:hypothetical protein n=1 Tax=Sphingobium sp. CFD-1 TaxID=2878545 RepID=UPI00214B82C7|nr:hypothetical protein [Sphingobium sp. CFD-1]
MGKATVTIMTCDRCDEREEIRLPDQEYAWGRIHFAQINGPIWIGSQHNKPGGAEHLDMCPACMKDAKNFWEQGKFKTEPQQQERQP